MRRSALSGVAFALLVAGFVHADDRLRQAHAAEIPSAPNGAEDALSSVEQEEHSLRSELESFTAKEDVLRRRLILRGRAMYRLVRVGLLPAGGGLGSLLDHAIKMERARRALEQDSSEYRAVGARRVELLRKLDDVATRKAPLELEREAAAKTRALLDEAEDRKRSFDRAFETSTGAADYVAIYGGGLGGPSGPEGARVTDAEGFRSMKGRLPFPLAGRAEIRAVRRAAAPGPGLEMSAPAGAPVRAVFGGRVAFADVYDSFGQIVILDHGDHYYTLMGGLGAIEVRVGDDLSAGAKVGTVGSASTEDRANEKSGSKTAGPSLYFEIRHGATAIDPGPWLGL